MARGRDDALSSRRRRRPGVGVLVSGKIEDTAARRRVFFLLIVSRVVYARLTYPIHSQSSASGQDLLKRDDPRAGLPLDDEIETKTKPQRR